MNWVTRRRIRVNRTATAWLIRRFIDPRATILFVEADEVAEVQQREGAIGFDAPGATYPHRDAAGRCSFEALVEEHCPGDHALRDLAAIVHVADLPGDGRIAPEAAGLRAISEGFPLVVNKDDETIERAAFLYDALYASLQEPTMILPFHRLHVTTLIALVAGTVVLTALGCQGAGREVVVYTSVDQPFSEPILKDFERETGIAVKTVFDTEEAKSTGVMNRLLAEKDNAQADVYWANEPIRAEFLKIKGVATPYASPDAEGIPATFKDPEHYWTGFSARARVLIIGKKVSPKPNSVTAYLDPRFKGRAAIANPIFGTTTAYAAALFTLWGDGKTKAFFDAMKANGVRITASNGDSADLVAAGESDFALVDSDDAFNRTQQGKPVSMVVPDQGEGQVGVLLLPNAVLLVKGAPHAANGEKLVDYLLSKETEKKLAFADCAQIPLRPGVETPAHVPRIEALKLMVLNISAVAREMEGVQPFLKAWAGF